MERPGIKLVDERGQPERPESIPEPDWTPSSSEYHDPDDPTWSSTALRKMLTNPQEEWARRHLGVQPDPPGPAMRLGTMVNDFLLRQWCPVEFRDQKVVPVQDRRTKAFKERHAEDPDVVTKFEYETAIRILDSMARLDTQKKRQAWTLLTAPGYDEYAIRFPYVTELGGVVKCRAMLDRAADIPGLGGPCCVELKTSTVVDDSSFGRRVVDFGYDVQAALYLHGFTQVVRERDPAASPQCVYVILESVPPFRVNVLWAGESVLEGGRVKLDYVARSVIRWQEEDPSRAWCSEWEDNEEINELEPPKWADWSKYL